MKYIYTMLLSVLLCCSFAETVSKDSCQIIGQNFFYELTARTVSPVSTEDISSQDKGVTGYIFNWNGGGFTIVGNENGAASPVDGYGFTGVFTLQNIPPKNGLAYFKINQQQKIYTIKKLGIHLSKNWQRLASAPKPSFKLIGTAIAPLLATTWDQYPYYNAYCPYNATDQQNAVTGCVATAMAQILRQHNYPPVGIGQNCYTDAPPYYSNNYGVICDTFSKHTYNWTAMPNAVSATTYASVAQLMFDCGAATDMDYGDINQGGSGAYVCGSSPSAQYAYAHYFGYIDSMLCENRPTDSAGYIAFKNLILSDLSKGWPIQYEGYDPSGGGHTWVLDGYDGTSMFHMNWGWGGADNGYFALADLAVAGYDFSTSDGALLHIHPPVASNVCVVTSIINVTNIKLNSATINWTGNTNYSYQLKWNVSGGAYTTLPVQTTTMANLTGLPANSTIGLVLTVYCSAGGSGVVQYSFPTPSNCPASDYLQPLFGKWVKDPYGSGKPVIPVTLHWNKQNTDSLYKCYVYNKTYFGGGWNTPQNYAKDTFVILPNTDMPVPLSQSKYYIYTLCKDGEVTQSPLYTYNVPDTTAQVQPTPPPPTIPHYCAFNGLSYWEWIKYIKINNTSISNNQTAYSNDSFMIIKLKAIDSITLMPGFCCGAWPETWSIYADFNNNGSFDDAGELLYRATNNGTITNTFSCQAFSGAIRIRIEIAYSGGGGTSCAATNGGGAMDVSAMFDTTTKLAARVIGGK